VIARAVFGVEAGPRQEELKTRIRALLAPRDTRIALFLRALSNGRLGKRSWERFVRRRDRVTEAILAEIDRRRGEPDLEEREDVLSMLLLARDEAGEPMTDSELRDELVTLLVAGHETTATGLAWTFELLLRNPEARRRVESEIAEGGHAYTDAVVKESLRIRPVIPGVGRKVRGEPFELGDHVIPPGIEINPSIAVIHRRADRYPDHERFDPERFLGPDAPDTYTWLPFGGGTRRCIGASFATFEMRVVVRRVLERTDLRPADETPERGVRRDVTFAPRRGVRVRLARAPSAAHV
jgi:cytochrome P450